MSRKVKFLVSLSSLFLLAIASLYWVSLIVICHPYTRILIKLQRHERVRRVYARGCRVGYAIFRLWGLRVSSNHPCVRLPQDRPIVLVASHHSSLDMCFMLGLLEDTFGARNLRFVSRPGLDSGIPTISQYIDRYCFSLSRAGGFRARQQKEDRLLLAEYCKTLNRENGVLTIFPEGVKPRNLPEHSRSFNPSGLSIILENMPDALVVPVAIKGTGEFYSTPRRWKHLLSGMPRFGVSIKISVLPALEQSSCPDKLSLIRRCEDVIHREHLRLQQGAEHLTHDAGLERDCEEAC